MNALYIKKCLEKISKRNWYGTRKEAEQMASIINTKSGDKPVAYLCEHCGKYHIGKKQRL